jgi:GGDEF domain-containing protein
MAISGWQRNQASIRLTVTLSPVSMPNQSNTAHDIIYQKNQKLLVATSNNIEEMADDRVWVATTNGASILFGTRAHGFGVLDTNSTVFTNLGLEQGQFYYSVKDPFTQVHNRRGFTDAVDKEFIVLLPST